MTATRTITTAPGTTEVALFKGLTLLVLATGIGLHTSSLFFADRVDFVRTIMTPQFDVLFAIPMTVAGLLGVWLYRRAIFTSVWQRGLYLFLCAYFLLSIILHVRTVFTWDTSYVLAFPAFYPFVAMTIMVVLGVLTIRQRFSPARAR